jgi:hypothetical protein
VVGLSSVDRDFPMHMWDRLLHQADISLNLLPTSIMHPLLSEADHFQGLIDYNKIAFAPPGCNIIADENQSQKRTWAPSGQSGYSLGPAMHHYRCHTVYIKSTASERIVDTLELFPHNSPMPQISSLDRLLMTVHDMTVALNHPYPDVPFYQFGDDTITALTTLSAIFKNKYKKPSAPVIKYSHIKATENKRTAVLIQPVITSPLKDQLSNKTTSESSPAHVSESQNYPQLMRVQTRACDLSPINISQ